jgi:transposase
MIAPGADLKVYVATVPVDFRKGHDGLAALVQQMFGLDPFSGAAFVFRTKRADRVKILVLRDENERLKEQLAQTQASLAPTHCVPRRFSKQKVSRRVGTGREWCWCTSGWKALSCKLPAAAAFRTNKAPVQSLEQGCEHSRRYTHHTVAHLRPHKLAALTAQLKALRRVGARIKFASHQHEALIRLPV